MSRKKDAPLVELQVDASREVPTGPSLNHLVDVILTVDKLGALNSLNYPFLAAMPNTTGVSALSCLLNVRIYSVHALLLVLSTLGIPTSTSETSVQHTTL